MAVKKGHKFSAETRRKMSVAAKARYAKIKAQAAGDSIMEVVLPEARSIIVDQAINRYIEAKEIVRTFEAAIQSMKNGKK